MDGVSMKLKLPFFNKQNYIVLKAYTFNKRTHEQSPIVVTEKVKTSGCPVNSNTYMQFNTCYGWIKSQKHSVTIPSWCEMSFNGDVCEVPPGNFTIAADHGEDSVYNCPSDTKLKKLISPWAIECNKPNLPFVMTKHILSRNDLDIVTGVLPFGNYMYAPHIFYKVKEGTKSSIKFNEPLVAIYPLSELPIHMECYCDPDYFRLLNETQGTTRPYFRGVGIKDVLYHKRS